MLSVFETVISFYTIFSSEWRIRFCLEYFKIKAKNADIALAIARLFNDDIGRL